MNCDADRGKRGSRAVQILAAIWLVGEHSWELLADEMWFVDSPPHASQPGKRAGSFNGVAARESGVVGQ